jgi:signal transduction histidine kinase
MNRLGRRAKCLLREPAVVRAGKAVVPDAVEKAAALGWCVAAVAALVGVGAVMQDGPSPFTAGLAAIALVPFVLDANDIFLPRLVAAAIVLPAAFALDALAPQPNAAAALFLLVLLAGHTSALGSTAERLITLAAAEGWLVYQHSLALPSFGTGWIGWIVGCFLATGMGYALHRELKLFLQLHEAQAALALQAVEDERRRIAREVHDVIAHSLTVTMLHLTGARLTLEHDPGATAEALAALHEAERAGRQSLTEIRRTVGLLATSEQASGGAPVAPLPGARDLEALVADFLAAGLEVTLTVTGDAEATSATVGLALYRIVQESLTNAAKHAPGAPVQVAASFATDVHVEISNPLTRPDRAGEAGGLGLPGMTERAELLGGSLAAGRIGDGWLVTATVPRLLTTA